MMVRRGPADPSRPFLGLLSYNAAAAFEPPDDFPPAVLIPPGASEWVRRHSRYMTAVRFLDSLIGRVLDDLARRDLDKRTVVIVTSDHGMEFDENRQGFTGHGTAYSELQMHTPLIVPGRGPGDACPSPTYTTTWCDPLTELFGCANPSSTTPAARAVFRKPMGLIIAASNLDSLDRDGAGTIVRRCSRSRSPSIASSQSQSPRACGLTQGMRGSTVMAKLLGRRAWRRG